MAIETPTQAGFDSDFAALTASSEWVNGSEAEREELAYDLFTSSPYQDIWETVGDWWAGLWEQIKDWLTNPKALQPISGWFKEWWNTMFPPLNLPWNLNQPVGGPG